MYYPVPVPVPVPIPTTDDMHHHLITCTFENKKSSLNCNPRAYFPRSDLSAVVAAAAAASFSSPSHPIPIRTTAVFPRLKLTFFIDCTKRYLHIHTIIYKKSHLSLKTPPYPPPSKKTTRPHPPVAPRRASMLARLACKLLLLQQYTTLPGLVWARGLDVCTVS